MVPLLTPERIAEIRERWEKATPGPWYAAANSYVVGGNLTSQGHKVCQLADPWIHNPNQDDDAPFLAHSWQDIQDLLDEVERLRSALRPFADAWRDRASDPWKAGNLEGDGRDEFFISIAPFRRAAELVSPDDTSQVLT